MKVNNNKSNNFLTLDSNAEFSIVENIVTVQIKSFETLLFCLTHDTVKRDFCLSSMKLLSSPK